MSGSRWFGRTRDHRACASTRRSRPIQLVNVDEGAKYTDVLPSLNLYYDLDQHNRIRFALAKVMARPRMDDMRANLVPSFDGSVCQNRGNLPPCGPGVTVNPWSASGGNPELQPWRAKELDIGYEWYGGKASYFALHGFYMWLDNYIYTQPLAGRLHRPHAAADRSRIISRPNAVVHHQPIGSS